MIAAAAMLMSMAACEGTGPESNGTDNGEGEGGEASSYSIALSDPMDAEIILNSDDTETFKIGLKTNLSEDQLTVSVRDVKLSGLDLDQCIGSYRVYEKGGPQAEN